LFTQVLHSAAILVVAGPTLPEDPRTFEIFFFFSLFPPPHACSLSFLHGYCRLAFDWAGTMRICFFVSHVFFLFPPSVVFCFFVGPPCSSHFVHLSSVPPQPSLQVNLGPCALFVKIFFVPPPFPAHFRQGLGPGRWSGVWVIFFFVFFLCEIGGWHGPRLVSFEKTR